MCQVKTGEYLNKLKSFLLNDEDFWGDVLCLFDEEHHGTCGIQRYEYFSDVYKKFGPKPKQSYKEWRELWINTILKRISEKEAEKCLTSTIGKGYQQSAILVAYATNLPDEQIRDIANPRYWRVAFSNVNNYLRNAVAPDGNLKYTVIIDGKKVPAVLAGTRIIPIYRDTVLYEMNP